MLTDFRLSESDKSVIKYLTTPQMRCYTTLWNYCAQKSQWPRTEWSRLPCKTQPFGTAAEKNHPLTLASFLFTDEMIQRSQW